MVNKTSLIKYLPLTIFCMIFLSLIWAVIFFYENKKVHKQDRFKKKTPIISIFSHQFDPISKEHVQLRKAAADSLDFPISYQHIETIYFRNEQKKEIMIKMRFTGLDTYNTKIKYCLRATYSYHGEEMMAPSFCDLRA